MKTYLVIAGSVASLFIAASASTQGRCEERPRCTPENVGKVIQDRIKEGADKIIRTPSATERAREMGKTLQDCVNCAREALKESTDRVLNKMAEPEL